MHSVTLQEAEGHLAELAQLVAMGQHVQIRCTDGSIIRLVKDQPVERTFGQYVGKIEVADDFNNELPESYWLGNEGQ